MALRLVIGNKNYSSWSLRPWIAMKVAGIAFEEEVISLDAKDFKARVGAISGTGKVPALSDGDVNVWESLAILEYLAEKFPQARLWPSDANARAHARAVAAEMHAGFVPLRRHCPMNMWRPAKARELTPEAAADVRRIEALWTDCRTRFGGEGPFLFGSSARPTRCTRRSSPACRPTRSRLAPSQAPICRRLLACQPGRNGGRPRSKSLGCCRTTRSIGRPSCACNTLS